MLSKLWTSFARVIFIWNTTSSFVCLRIGNCVCTKTCYHVCSCRCSTSKQRSSCVCVHISLSLSLSASLSPSRESRLSVMAVLELFFLGRRCVGAYSRWWVQEGIRLNFVAMHLGHVGAPREDHWFPAFKIKRSKVCKTWSSKWCDSEWIFLCVGQKSLEWLFQQPKTEQPYAKYNDSFFGPLFLELLPDLSKLTLREQHGHGS